MSIVASSTTQFRAFVLTIACMLICSGCGSGEEEIRSSIQYRPSPRASIDLSTASALTAGVTEISEQAQKQAAQLYGNRCATCHGDSGKGDGPSAVGLNPKPADFSEKEWQSSVTDSHIERIIVEGGVGVGRSPLMPPNPDLRSTPEVLAALRDIIREFEQ